MVLERKKVGFYTCSIKFYSGMGFMGIFAKLPNERNY